MRTIKFRGKKLENGEWLYGDLVQDDRDCCYIYPNDCGGLYANNKVDTETVGQFTGLLDKNGKEIYEGDYVEVSQSGFGGVVTWHLHGYFYIKEPYKFKYNEESDCLSLGEFIDNPRRKVTIVDNIYDNKDLIKGE